MIAIIGFNILTYKDRIEYTNIIPVSVTVSEKFFLTKSQNDLTFGRIPPEHNLTRKITITNRKNYPMEIIITIDEKLSDMLKISDIEFILLEKESKELSVMLIVPSHKEYGDYNGNLYIKFKKI
jgi:hypothetical protein